MKLTRRGFFALTIMTPLAMKAMSTTKQPTEILESTATGRCGWDSKVAFENQLRICNKWVKDHAKMYFTGFRSPIYYSVMAGHLLWQGIATFRSGRKEMIHYYVTLNIDPIEIWNPPALAPYVDRCLEKVQSFKDQFHEDGTICTVKHPRRLVASIEWYEDERYTGIPVPYFSADPRTAEEISQAYRKRLRGKVS